MAPRRRERKRLHGRMLTIYTTAWLARRFLRAARSEARRSRRGSSRRSTRRPRLARR